MSEKVFQFIALISVFSCTVCVFDWKDTRIKEIPYQASVYKNGQFICGGVIIDDDTILTAAHCIRSNHLHQYTIRVGRTNHKKGQKFNVLNIYVHPNYNKTINDYDIAVLKIENWIEFGFSINSIPLHDQNKEIISGTTCQISGWGLPKKISTKLKAAYLSVISNDKCSKYFDRPITPNMICANSLSNPRPDLTVQQVYDGDAGGPLVCDRKLVGIASFVSSRTCYDCPSVYVRITAAYDWINQKKKEKSYCRKQNQKDSFLKRWISGN